MPLRPTLNARELRALVDAAASQRKKGGDPVYGVVDLGANGLALKFVRGAEGERPVNAVMEIDTHEVWPDRTPPTSVILTHDDQSTKNLAETYDAVFWSEAAVEKFVLPYYASKAMWDAAYTLSLISKAWYGHVPRPSEDDSDADPAVAGTEGEPVIPFAMGHTPDSDYGMVHDLHVLFTEEGVIRGMRITEFVKRYRRHPAAG
jgi:hypothetical protein